MSCVLLFCGTLAAQKASTGLSEPLAPLKFLIGGTWVGEMQSPHGVVHVQRHLEPALNGAAIRFRTTFSGVDQYEGLFAYNASKRKVEFWYPSRLGDLTAGTVTLSGPGKLEFEFAATDAKGVTAEMRVHMTQTGENSYDATLESREGGSWKTQHTVHFKREK